MEDNQEIEAVGKILDWAIRVASGSENTAWKITAENKTYPEYAKAMEKAAQGHPQFFKKSWSSLQIIKLYPEVDLNKWLKPWYDGPAWSDIKTLASRAVTGGVPDLRQWAITRIASICAKHALVLPEGTTMRDIPGLLVQVERAHEDQQLLDMKQQGRKANELSQAKSEVASLQARIRILEAPCLSDERSCQEPDYVSSSE